jgi:hypothetical protein
MKHFTVFCLLLFSVVMHSQVEFAERNYRKVTAVLSKHSKYTQAKQELDSLRLTYKDTLNNRITFLYKRSIDFDHYHVRLIAMFEMYEYQIDFVVKEDDILFTSLLTEYHKEFTYQERNNVALNSFLTQRNQFYSSNKTLKGLEKEIIKADVFAMICGDASNVTQQGKQIKRFARQRRFARLGKLLSHLNCEQQAFAVEGFSLLQAQSVAIPQKYLLLVEHIRNRNSEVQICSGSVTGFVEKIY